MTTSSPGGSASVHAALWGRRARDWAEWVEQGQRPLFVAVLDAVELRPGLRLLDVGCGSGEACQLAAARGAQVTGLDATPELLAIARERVPDGQFHQGEMERLPFADGSMDVVTGFNSFQYAATPLNALREARRVVRPDGRVAVATWGTAEANADMNVLMQAMGSLLPPPPPGTPGPFALAREGALSGLVRQAGLTPLAEASVACPWDFSDLDTALRLIMSSGSQARVIDQVGEVAVREVVADALTHFRTPDGRYRMMTSFIYLIATP